MPTKYKRVLVKLSGEALSDREHDAILGAYNLNKVSQAIKDMVDLGVQVCIVVGAGNIWRGRLAESIGIERSTADYMGMLGTIINSLALQSALENNGMDTRVMTSIEMRQIAEPYIKRKAERHLEKGRVIIFGGGTGNPYFTTDTTAALRANELNCDAILMAKNGVDGVYSADPRKNKDAVLFKELTYKEMLNKELEVMDNTAVSLCMHTNIELRVFNMADYFNFHRVIMGEEIGTTIKKGE
mgnify:FL=1|jgi:UMP kinase